MAKMWESPHGDRDPKILKVLNKLSFDTARHCNFTSLQWCMPCAQRLHNVVMMMTVHMRRLDNQLDSVC